MSLPTGPEDPSYAKQSHQRGGRALAVAEYWATLLRLSLSVSTG